jgi:hypothetical protein
MATVRIGVHHKDVGTPRRYISRRLGKRYVYIPLGRNMHHVHWEVPGEGRYNDTSRSFSDWGKAVRYAQSLAKKYSNLGYKIEFTKIVD